MSLSNSIQNRNYHLQGPGGMTIPETSPLRDEPFTWSSYIPPPPPPPPPQADSPSWSYSGGHARNRSTSSTSSASSDTAPTPYMASLIFFLSYFHTPPRGLGFRTLISFVEFCGS